MSLGRHRTRHLGAQAFQLVLGHIATHQLERAGQHPGLPCQRQTFDHFFLALPVHAEIAQLLLGSFSDLSILSDCKKRPNRIRLFLRQRLAHVQPVGAHHRFQ